MNRYFFWILMVLPWTALTIYITTREDAEITTFIFLSLLIYIVTIIELRRRKIGMTGVDVLKSLVPFVGLKQRQKLYFAKP
ncbi:hypothetical protein [Pontibacter fetidus]|uniref:Uncharacterized protein n=1 Tax=Pontibacter fetidus TaxID=2700082 RepID=A0A6B2GZ24_9BACT|nr:hypothetical protein [Pontibacter fetidus]NDK55068.1 hypothetical protein [Pontibacter fetidus]